MDTDTFAFAGLGSTRWVLTEVLVSKRMAVVGRMGGIELTWVVELVSMIEAAMSMLCPCHFIVKTMGCQGKGVCGDVDRVMPCVNVIFRVMLPLERYCRVPDLLSSTLG